jgi:hypothetical protein
MTKDELLKVIRSSPPDVAARTISETIYVVSREDYLELERKYLERGEKMEMLWDWMGDKSIQTEKSVEEMCSWFDDKGRVRND